MTAPIPKMGESRVRSREPRKKASTETSSRGTERELVARVRRREGARGRRAEELVGPGPRAEVGADPTPTPAAIVLTQLVAAIKTVTSRASTATTTTRRRTDRATTTIAEAEARVTAAATVVGRVAPTTPKRVIEVMAQEEETATRFWMICRRPRTKVARRRRRRGAIPTKEATGSK